MMFRKGDIAAFACAAALTLGMLILMQMTWLSPAKGNLELMSVVFLTPYGFAFLAFALARLRRERKNAEIRSASWTLYLLLAIVELLAIAAVKALASIFIITAGLLLP